jgi:hypothetical protein
MKLKQLLLIVLLLLTIQSFAQNSVTEIKTKSGVKYITTTTDFPIAGTYLFEGAEPTVELNGSGTGNYQLHDQLKRPVIWGLECSESGELKFIKGYNSAAYTLWYQYTDSSQNNTDTDWNAVEFSIHFNTSKMYIQGERVKDNGETTAK